MYYYLLLNHYTFIFLMIFEIVVNTVILYAVIVRIKRVRYLFMALGAYVFSTLRVILLFLGTLGNYVPGFIVADKPMQLQSYYIDSSEHKGYFSVLVDGQILAVDADVDDATADKIKAAKTTAKNNNETLLISFTPSNKVSISQLTIVSKLAAHLITTHNL